LVVDESWVVLSPDTGYFDLGDERVELLFWSDARCCFGITNAFVCFSKERSLHSAEMSGRSRFLLFSRKILMSSCCWRLSGAMIRFDSGQMTCESFRSNGFVAGEEVADVAIFGVSTQVVRFVEDFDCSFMLDEEEQIFRVDGFAGTKRSGNVQL
jgi:hypothetical protein